MDNDFDNDQSIEIDEDSPQYLQDFNNIIQMIEQEEVDPYKLEDLFRDYYINYNSLNPFIEYCEDIPNSQEFVIMIKELTKKFFIEENNRPDKNIETSKYKINKNFSIFYFY